VDIEIIQNDGDGLGGWVTLFTRRRQRSRLEWIIPIDKTRII
jgi:hypothetical protein